MFIRDEQQCSAVKVLGTAQIFGFRTLQKNYFRRKVRKMEIYILLRYEEDPVD